MLQNSSICTGFRLFQNSNVLTTLENIANVVANLYIYCCAFAGDSYRESKPGNEKPKSEVSGQVMLYQKNCHHSDYGKHVTRDSI